MAARPRSQQAALKPFLAPEGEGGAPAQSDSGGASFLGQVGQDGPAFMQSIPPVAVTWETVQLLPKMQDSQMEDPCKKWARDHPDP